MEGRKDFGDRAGCVAGAARNGRGAASGYQRTLTGRTVGNNAARGRPPFVTVASGRAGDWLEGGAMVSTGSRSAHFVGYGGFW